MYAHIYVVYYYIIVNYFSSLMSLFCFLEVGKLLSVLLNVPNSGHRNLSWHPMRQ